MMSGIILHNTSEVGIFVDFSSEMVLLCDLTWRVNTLSWCCQSCILYLRNEHLIPVKLQSCAAVEGMKNIPV